MPNVPSEQLPDKPPRKQKDVGPKPWLIVHEDGSETIVVAKSIRVASTSDLMRERQNKLAKATTT